MDLNLSKKVSCQILEIKVGTQETNSLKLDNFGIVIASFSIKYQEK